MVDQLLIGDFRNFVYLITHDGESIVIDPQSDLTPWQNRIKELGSKLVGVALTHSHWDHVAGIPGIIREYGADAVPIYVHRSDATRLEKSPDKRSARMVFVSEGDRIKVGGRELEVLHTPGHSAGECSYLLRGNPDSLFTGDTVFVGDVGRTDLESGSNAELFATLTRLKTLNPDTIIYPGHDYGRTPTSTIARECAESAAFKCSSVEELSALP